MKTIGAGETTYTKEDADNMRNKLIELRDGALSQGDMEWSVQLSHTIAFMAHAIKDIWPDEP